MSTKQAPPGVFVVTSLDQRLVKCSASDVRPGVQALLKCVSGEGEDVFPLAALERGLVIILNSLASFCIDAPQAPKLVRPTMCSTQAMPRCLGSSESTRAWQSLLMYSCTFIATCCSVAVKVLSRLFSTLLHLARSSCWYGLLQLPCKFHM